jgi:hypothetical protein
MRANAYLVVNVLIAEVLVQASQGALHRLERA